MSQNVRIFKACMALCRIARLNTSVLVLALFVELDDGTPLQVGLIIKLSENPAKFAVKLVRPMRFQIIPNNN